MIYDWYNITSMAYMTLIELNIRSFPIPPNKIKCKDVIVTSFQKYARLTGASIEELTCNHEFDDAIYMKELRLGLKLILYNKEKCDNRIKHTLWHEVGHVKCDHLRHGEKEEIEAHFFAAQANAPNVIIKMLNRRGYQVTVKFLMECFGISGESANKKMDYLRKYSFEHKNEFDNIIQQQFSDYIDLKYPIKTKHYYDDYFDDLEIEREKWFI